MVTMLVNMEKLPERHQGLDTGHTVQHSCIVQTEGSVLKKSD